MAVRKGGDLIAEFLVKEKIPYVFGICGHGNVGLLDSLYDVSDEVKLVSPRHEQTAAHMADGFFRIGHRPAATLTSTGPGSANLIMALAVAQTDSSAIFSITANVPTSQFNRGPFQELNRHYQADFNNVIKPVVKRSFQPSRVEMLPLAMRQAAMTMTSGRPGPVNLDVPYNLFMESAEVQEEPAWNGYNSRRSGASEADVARTVDFLLAAERPVIFIGHGVTLVGGERRADGAGGAAVDPGDLIAERHGLSRHAQASVARLYRPQRRLPRQSGRPPCRSGACHRRALRRPLGVLLDARLFLEFSVDEAYPCRRRSQRDRPQLRAGSRYPRRRQGLPPAASLGIGSPQDRCRAALARLARDHRRLAHRVGGLCQAGVRDAPGADPPRAHRRRLPRRAAG